MNTLYQVLIVIGALFYLGMSSWGVWKLARGRKVTWFIIGIFFNLIYFIAGFLKIRRRR